MGAPQGVVLEKSERRLFGIIEAVLNTLNHVIIGFVAITLTWQIFSKDVTATPLHAWLCTIGFQLLTAEGIMMMYPANTFSMHLPTGLKRALHWLLQVVGTILGLAGLIVMIDHNRGKHFASTHGILGLTGIIIMVVNLVVGVCTFYSVKLKQFLRPVILKSIHNFIGLSGLVLTLLTLYYGYEYMRRRMDTNLVSFLQIMTIITILLTLIGSFKSLYRQLNFKDMFKE